MQIRTFQVNHITEEGECDYCGGPIIKGDSCHLVNDGEAYLCSRRCRASWVSWIAPLEKEKTSPFTHRVADDHPHRPFSRIQGGSAK